MLTMLISASSVCPHFYIVGVPPSASGLHVREHESLGPPAKGYIVSYSAFDCNLSWQGGGSGLVCVWWDSVQKGGDYVQLL